MIDTNGTPSPTTTIRFVILAYSRLVEQGLSDTDLTRRQARLVSRMLNLASNAYGTTYAYAEQRQAGLDAARKHLNDIVWDARVLIEVYGVTAGRDLDIAVHRANVILENL